MKLTNGELILAVNGLRSILDKDMPCKLGYNVQKNLRTVEGALKPYDEERIRQLKKYAQADENGNLVTNENGNAVLKPACVQEYKSVIEELQSIEVNIEICTVPLDDFNDLSLTGRDMYNLNFMIK